MKHIKTLNTRNLCESAKKGGCGECQTSCQSACKTSCGIANQQGENKKEKKEAKPLLLYAAAWRLFWNAGEEQSRIRRGIFLCKGEGT